MKSLFIISTALLLSFSSNAQHTIDKIVAQVGDNIILLSDIQGQKIQAIQAGVEVTPKMDCQILEELMFQKLLLNQAALDSIIISPQQVDAEMEQRIRVIEGQIGGRQKLEAFYGKTIGEIKREFRTVIEDQLLSQEMERTITADISVTPREVERFYKTIPYDSIPLISSQLSFQQIVHYPEIKPTDKQRAYDKLAKIRKGIVESGKNFSTQARLYSMDPGSAKDGGKIEATRGMMVPQFEAAAFSLDKNGVSEIFETQYGYHIVKLLDRKGDDYTCQHVLIVAEFDPDAITTAALKMDSCYKQIKSGEITWEQGVQLFSNEESTKENNGTITNPITGDIMWSMEDLNQVDRQIYLLTNAMETNEVSEPTLYENQIDRKEGIRLVRLTKRTAPHRANLKDDYALIKRAAENDKKQDVIAKWTRSKIGNAYIRLDEEFISCQFVNNWVQL
ncbi:MAG: peptidylprolyl isomerase [Crocinitomicaceae bacterium]|nr:peptidylprolyl isomerase [Crocinitomicaceae bacterium]MDB4075305.1 peptidylprolyl isomerase [Crocinitomicaceae bacterium]MDC0099942.1 peptidylprolyl isomerase [Crocinitomicaceae bacterium]MDC1385298.1 peptidylprolyl isomerase [Crocinitomicaceae bacterium]|tara:strand:+ start:5648 stop:6994 length:1347 start_codon:yes stop_codon:yes gene_type:complete